MSLRVHDINERAWRLYEEVGFRRVPERTEEMPVRELEGFPGRRVPPMVRRRPLVSIWLWLRVSC